MTDLAPTAEQNDALVKFGTGKSLAIEAGAGTGKTSTLVMLAKSTRRRGQYVAFNRAIVEESKSKFPTTVACSTAHSLAYRAIVSRNPWMADRLRSSKRMKSTEIADRLGLDEIVITLATGERKKLARSYLAGLAMRGVVRFCQTADREPEAHHVPYIDGIDFPPGRWDNNRVVGRALVGAMRRAWADLTDQHGSLPFKHDHYLKVWHLSNPRIAAEFILFDEAQDANPVLVDVIRQQAGHAQLVWVGDSQQQIYSFTGAVNALQTVGAEQTAFLTQSFRFGPAVAEHANELLEALDAPLRISGLGTIDSRVEEVDDPDVILCRTNATAVRNFLDALAVGRRPHLVGGGKDVVAFAEGAKDLMQKGWSSHPELACFSSWGEVQFYVEQDEQGGDLRLLVKLIDEFGADTIIEALRRMPNEPVADLVISTAHKSKGREWATVQIASDFPDEPKGEELRLLYVAVTRAKRRLDVTGVGFFMKDEEPALAGSIPVVVDETVPVGVVEVRQDGETVATIELPKDACPGCGADVRGGDAHVQGCPVVLSNSESALAVAEHLVATVNGTRSFTLYVGRTSLRTFEGSTDEAIALAGQVAVEAGRSTMLVDRDTGEVVAEIASS